MNLQDANKLFHEGVLALSRASQNGLRLDVNKARRNSNKLKNMIKRTEQEFMETSFYKHWDKSTGKKKVNINSDYQLGHFLYNTKKLTPIKVTPSGKGGTDEESLEALNIPALDKLVRIRKLRKMRDTYLHSFMVEEVDGFIHPNFNLHFARTYRSSSDSPNFQNIPVRDQEAKRYVRGCLYPRLGYQLLEVDYSGIEVCIAACYHKDPTMIEYINKDPSAMHTDMAKQIFMFGDEFDKNIQPYKTMRRGAKNGFVFPQFYGDYFGNNALSLSKWTDLPINGKYKRDHGLELPDGSFLGEHMKQNKISGIDDFTDHLRSIEDHFWNDRFPVYNDWKEKWWRDYQKNGYFDMFTGFRCKGSMRRNDVINYPVQGSAFHCLLWSLIRLDKLIREEGLKSRIIGQVHDSIIFDVYPPELNYILSISKRVTEVELLKHWKWIIVPLRIEAELCEVDQSWDKKKEIDLQA